MLCDLFILLCGTLGYDRFILLCDLFILLCGTLGYDRFILLCGTLGYDRFQVLDDPDGSVNGAASADWGKFVNSSYAMLSWESADEDEIMKLSSCM